MDDLKQTFAAMSPMVKLSSVVGHQGGSPTQQKTTYSKFSEVPGEELEKMRSENPDEYKRLSRQSMAWSVKSKSQTIKQEE